MVQELIDTREQKMASGYIVYIGRSLGKHKMLDHGTDMLRAITAAALEAQGGLGEAGADSEAMWADANPLMSRGLLYQFNGRRSRSPLIG